ncbi:hypothetical protein H5P28_11865 [Ruficoccus amylovorans]|uniref:Uncharacterized protein n=1 Tax=Ruficoccus amylovorans TaxID=1804625 RepID=A0A842HHB3_9BACT|nr:hypothetical protein [Ruficoccus amylovorans]MBC2594954.1 hypothetical protein [Ruficoccus amylovorans]
MKIILKILNETITHRQFRKLDGLRKELYPFKADQKLRCYTHELASDSPEKLQAEIDSIVNNTNGAKISLVVDKDAFHALTAQPRKATGEWSRPSYGRLPKDQLVDMCKSLGIEVDGRNTDSSMRKLLDIYYDAQEHLINAYDLPKAEAEVEPKTAAASDQEADKAPEADVETDAQAEAGEGTAPEAEDAKAEEGDSPKAEA